MAEAVGVFNRLWVAAGDSNASYSEFEFMEGSTLGLNEQFLNSNGMTGRRGRQTERTRRGTRQASGQLSFMPNPVEWDTILQWACGGTKSGNTIALTETLTARWCKVYRDVTGYWDYNSLKVNSMTLSCSEGSMLGCTLQLAGVDEAAGTAPSAPAAIDESAGPYVMTDCVLTLGGSAYAFRNFQLTLNNFVETKVNNSQTPTSNHAVNRVVTVAVGLPYGEASALYGSALAGISLSAVFTNGAKSLTITSPAIQTPRTPLPLGQRTAMTLDWQGTAGRVGSTQELTFTNVSA